MAEFPQFEEQQPILKTQNVNSKASGYDDMAKFFENVANKSAEKAVEIESEHSQSMYLHSAANIEQLKTTAQMQLAEHPDQSDKIASDTESAINMVKKIAFVNSKDREKLDIFASSSADDVALKATLTGISHSQLTSAFTYYANSPEISKTYFDALVSGDEKKAQSLQDAWVANLKGLVTTGAITPLQAANGLKNMHAIVDLASDHIKMFGRSDISAKDYHAVTSTPFNNDNVAHGPVEGNTQWLTNHYTQDKSFQGIISDISNGNMPNPQAFDSLKPHERQHALLAMEGKRIADGIIKSGTSFLTMESTLQDLNVRGRILNYKEQAIRNSLQTYTENLKNGNYLGAISETAQGAQIMQNYTNRNAAIAHASMDDSQKMKAFIDNKNNMVNEAVAYGHAHHIPDEYIKPIPLADLNEMQNSFKVNQDPTVVLKIMSQYNKTNQAYIANSLKNPEQRMIAQALTYAGKNVKPQDQIDLIAANQEGRSYDEINLKDTGINDGKISTRIASNLSDQLKYINHQYNPMDAQSLGSGMIDSTLKLAKYLAAKNNDLTMRGWTNYVDQATNIYKNSFQQVTGTNYAVNPAQLPMQLSHAELDILADYSTWQGYKVLRIGVPNPAVFDVMQGRNPLRMRISSTNHVEAIDQNGQVYFSQPFDTNLMAFAKRDIANRKKRKVQEAAEDFTKNIRGQFHVD